MKRSIEQGKTYIAALKMYRSRPLGILRRDE
jgi:hypothetical protein